MFELHGVYCIINVSHGPGLKTDTRAGEFLCYSNFYFLVERFASTHSFQFHVRTCHSVPTLERMVTSHHLASRKIEKTVLFTFSTVNFPNTQYLQGNNCHCSSLNNLSLLLISHSFRYFPCASVQTF